MSQKLIWRKASTRYVFYVTVSAILEKFKKSSRELFHQIVSPINIPKLSELWLERIFLVYFPSVISVASTREVSFSAIRCLF